MLPHVHNTNFFNLQRVYMVRTSVWTYNLYRFIIYFMNFCKRGDHPEHIYDIILWHYLVSEVEQN